MARCLVGVCIGIALSGMCRADVLDEMLPAPREVERRNGSIGEFGLANVEVRRAPVPGAPAKTADEAYILEITPSNVCITAASMRGERWARVTLDQLLRLSGGGRVPCCRIVDWPTLKWRGYMNDCGRNFLGMDGVKAIIDMMSRYKMNLFHWHLSDYHGWRLESRKYPQLQDSRAFLRQVGKYYTQRDFREIVRYAAERGVTVMPELDVPGHTLAFRRGMGVDSMSNECVRVALRDIFNELCSLAPADVMPFVHLGTDEVRVDPERCPGEWLDEWVEAVTSNGRSAVLWAPGQKTKAKGTIVDMVWYDSHVTNSPHSFIDAARMYNGKWTTFDILKRAAFLKPCRWPGVEDARRLGAVTCTWHDDNVGEDTYRLFVDAMVFPTIMLFGDNYWRGRDEDCPQFFQRLPDVSDPRFAFAADLERRAVAQRDKCLDDFRFAFPLVAQTAQRWRISDATGNVVATNVPDATVWFSSVDRKEDASSGYPVPGGSATAETWIWSPRRQSVGAWIDFTLFGCAYGRTVLPDHGEWNKAGAKIELNGQELAPPRWKRPGVYARTPSILRQDVPYTNDLFDTPFTDEGCVRREPYPIILNEGWNHVRVTVPYQRKGWGFIFSPVLGSSEHPHEVPGLRYRSDAPAALSSGGVGAWCTGTQSNVTVVPAPVREAASVPEDGPKISVFAAFIRKIANQRGISKAEAADLLYGMGVRGFDVGPGDPDLDELAATRLRPINFYYFPNWFGNKWSKALSPDDCLAKAVRLGVPRIMVVPPNFTDGKESPEEFERILAHMKAFVAEARKLSITVTVEDFGGTANCCSYSKYLKRFLDEIPDIRFALDSGNLYYAGRGEDIIDMMEFAKGRIGHVHLKDQLPTDNRTYATLGLGAVPNERIVKEVSATGYDGWFTLENPVGDVLNDTVRQVALLKSWLQSAGK